MSFELKPSQKYLKFIKPVLLNSFQDLTPWAKRDAEPILNQVQHKVQHDKNGPQNVRDKFSDFNV